MWWCHLQLLVALVSALGEAEQALDVGLCVKSMKTFGEPCSQGPHGHSTYRTDLCVQ